MSKLQDDSRGTQADFARRGPIVRRSGSFQGPEVDRSRRRFLRGLGGVTIALPMLDAFTRSKAAHAAVPYVPCAFIVNSCGVVQDGGDLFWPKANGALTKAGLAAETSQTASELADHADKLLFIKGINFGYQGTAQCGHADGATQVMTAAGIRGTRSNARATGESIDHRIARELNPKAKESLFLYAGRKGTYIDEFISYRGPGELRTAENNPANAYRQLLGLGTPTSPSTPMANTVVDLLKQRRLRVSDLVREQLASLKGRPELSVEDRRRLELHFSNLEELSDAVNPMLPTSGGALPAKAPYDMMDGQHAADANLTKAARLHIDLAVYAMATGVNRVAAIQVGAGADRTKRVIDGKLLDYSVHKISHRVNSDGASGPDIPNARMLHHKIDRLHAQDFKYLLDKMATVTTPDGSLLDIGFAVWTNELATGPSHSRNNVPYIVGGRARGALKTGQYINAGGILNNKLLNTLLNAAGVRKAGGALVDDFGDPKHPKGIISDILKV